MPRFALLLALLLPLSACGSDDADTPEANDPSVAEGSIADAAGAIEALPPTTDAGASGADAATVVGTMASAGDLNTLASLIEQAGLTDALAGEGPFTVFAPSDAAFEAAGVDTSDLDAVAAVLQAHVLTFRAMSIDMDIEQTVETLGGTSISITPGTPPTVASGGSRASVVRADLSAPNGVVHVIDAVLLP